MSLDVTLIATRPTEIYSGNITHNLNSMAEAAGIYKHLWRPEEIGITQANQLVEPLQQGLARLLADPAKYKAFDAPNGWGKYEHLVQFVNEYLRACMENGDAHIEVSR